MLKIKQRFKGWNILSTINGTRTIERAFEILECFDEEHYELGISEIAKMSLLSKATTYRIIKTLESKGYIIQDVASSKYRLGVRVLRLSKLFLSSLDFRRVALPYMQIIKDELNESVNLYVSNGQKRICVERIESTQPLRRVLRIGDELPLEKGAAGSVLIAFGDSSEDESKFATIRKNGYAVSHGERAESASSVAAPIFDHRGKIVAALAIAGPTYRFDEKVLPNYISVVVENAYSISRELGYRTFK